MFDQCTNNRITEPRRFLVERDSSISVPVMNDSAEASNTIAESVKKGDLVVVYTDDTEYDYYLLKATHNYSELQQSEQDDWNNCFGKNTGVVRGQYYDKTGPGSYKIISTKTALISAHSVLCVLPEVKAMSKVFIPDHIHASLISWAEECSN